MTIKRAIGGLSKMSRVLTKRTKKDLEPKVPVPVDSWSYSRWFTFMECAFRFYLQYVVKLPTTQGPALARGDMIHVDAEKFVRGVMKRDKLMIKSHMRTLPATLERFEPGFKYLIESGAIAEEQWAFARDWSVTEWFYGDAKKKGLKAPWVRIKTDAHIVTKTSVEIYDYKSGRVKDLGYNGAQLELYVVGARRKYPGRKKYSASFWYLDHGVPVEMEYTAAEVEGLEAEWEKRVARMLMTTVFEPQPGPYCRWCDFSKSKGGPCKF